MALRFPNPGSNFKRMVNTYGLLYEEFGEDTIYDLDDATEVLVDHYQVSSSGAVGQQAAERSYQEDRSRDSLYNQLKMYSELYRMLGWIHPSAEKKLLFRNTLIGQWVSKEDSEDRVSGLLQECLLGIAFPNPNTENKGVKRLRFFPHLLDFMEKLDGIAHRDEIIVGLYTISDDSKSDLISQKVDQVRNFRGDKSERKAALEVVADKNDVQPNTLQNYTRFPLGVIKADYVDWAEPEYISDVYENSTKFYVLTENGRNSIRRFREGIDVRSEDFERLSWRGKAYLVCVGYAAILLRAGYKVFSDDLIKLEDMRDEYSTVEELLGDTSLRKVYFSPYQQASHDAIRQGEALYNAEIAQA
ncbi:hypothetical protein GGP79_003214 [Salinibacter ruber]|uniref:hypothetical protein n=1 Tax=Salinibacter ruber TaxID=146919 RepID=UPI002168DD95|nr:hypothetical protein [Salinibacter ruber]MCS3755230.1 hypothetical protein [Salinibacter ruber]